MEFVMTPPTQATVPVVGTDALFPVHRIYCVGRNYAEHAREMGGDGREAPFFFTKPADAVLAVPDGVVGDMPYPAMTLDLHHEVELVVALGKGGRNIAAVDAHRHIGGYAIGLDMTRRDLQAAAKKAGQPWCTAKAFDYSAPISAIHPVSATGLITRGAIHLKVNGKLRQSGDISQMSWNVAEIIEHLSQYFMLQAGDLIFTGTPAGVAAVRPGDLLEAGIEGLGELRVRIA